MRMKHARAGMTSDLDIYCSAKLLIDQHGEDAPIFAAMQADKLAEAGNREGRRVWLRVLKAVEVLERTQPKREEPTH